MNPQLLRVTNRIIEHSRGTHSAYLTQIEQAKTSTVRRSQLVCGNLAHGFVACQSEDKASLKSMLRNNVAIITSYNDMLSAHQPYEHYPEIIRKTLHEANAVSQVTGDVSAMCDGITQGQDGMRLSLLSREMIAMSAAIGLSHNMFDGALFLGVCDKIVPDLTMAALSFGHLPAVFVPSGPMASDLPNKEKMHIRQLYAEGKVDRMALLESETASYHAPGTYTFYGTASTNQMVMEFMGMQLPGSFFVHPNSPLRGTLTAVTARRVTRMTDNDNERVPIGKMIDERVMMNGVIALLATGGSTNRTVHLVAMTRAAGIQTNWDDFSDLSDVVPLMARLHPNGPADINHFQATGDVPVLVRELLKAGLLHENVNAVTGFDLSRCTLEPWLNDSELDRQKGAEKPLDGNMITSFGRPFSHHGGTKVLSGNLGRAVMKTSAVPVENQVIEAPAAIFENQHDVIPAFEADLLDCGCVAVVRRQGPRANGMSELHKLVPPLGVLLDRHFKIALVTDGRLSGASSKMPSAIHVTPETYDGGLLAKIHDGGVIRMNGQTGELTLLVDGAELAAREPHVPDPSASRMGTGRELFSVLHEKLSGAERSAACITFQDDKFIIRREKALTKNWKASAESILAAGPIIPVIVVKKLEHAVSVAKALVADGVRVLEVTLRTECAVGAIRAIAKGVPETIMGADTVLNPQQLAEVTGAGTQFAISPGLTEPLLRAVTEGTTPLIPGINTVSELMLGMDYGLEKFEFFPAEANGGVKALQAIAGPFSRVRLCPTGGISPASYRDYLMLRSMLRIGGSRLVPAGTLEAGDYDRITKLACEAVEGAKL